MNLFISIEYINSTWANGGTYTFTAGGITNRGYTGHVQQNTVFESETSRKQIVEPIPMEIGKMLPDFVLINMFSEDYGFANESATKPLAELIPTQSGNGRLYDPALGRMLSPDNYVQSPNFTQSFNRYSYCWNNPMVYTDPSGEIVWMPIIIGAAVGAYIGGTIANEGNYNPIKWDYNSGQTWGYMLGGAVAGGLSGYVGGAIAASGIPMANTLGIMGASLTNSVGTYAYTGGKTDVSVSFGIGSYNFTNNTWGGIWNWNENSILENIGYSFGALANLSDAFSLFTGGGENIDVNSASTKDDWWGHSSITDERGNTLVSVGPETSIGKNASLSETWKNSITGARRWDSYVGDKGTWTTRLNNVSSSAINNYASGITRWDLLLNSCVGHTTMALMRAGVPTIYAFHPHMLNLQLFIRQVGIYSSPYLYQIP